MTGDDRWYEAAFVVGITNALNVVADGLGAAPMPPVEPETAPAEVRTVFADIRAFYGTGTPVADVLGGEIPTPFGLIAHDPGYLADVCKVTVFLKNVADREKVNTVRKEYFGPHRPASTLIEISRLVRDDLLIEIEATAVLPDGAKTKPASRTPRQQNKRRRR